MDSELIKEGIIPMNFNFKQAKQSIQGTNYTGLGFDDPNSPNFNPSINMNDPVVRAQVMAKKKRDEESVKQQMIANYKMYAKNILSQILNSIENLIKGNSKVGFNETDSILLLNSIKNKINELILRNTNYINNMILLDEISNYINMANSQYEQDIIRYKLNNIETYIAFNSEKGIVIFNPNKLRNIIEEFLPKNQDSINISNREQEFICE